MATFCLISRKKMSKQIAQVIGSCGPFWKYAPLGSLRIKGLGLPCLFHDPFWDWYHSIGDFSEITGKSENENIPLNSKHFICHSLCLVRIVQIFFLKMILQKAASSTHTLKVNQKYFHGLFSIVSKYKFKLYHGLHTAVVQDNVSHGISSLTLCFALQLEASVSILCTSLMYYHAHHDVLGPD